MDESWKRGLCRTCASRTECFSSRAKDPEGYGSVRACSGYKSDSGRSFPTAECTWGHGPAVLLILGNNPQQDYRDLTSAQAKQLAASLLMAADLADQMESICSDHDAADPVVSLSP